VGLTAAIKHHAVSFLVVFNWVYALLSRRPKLHAARFARVDELAKLMATTPDKEASLILGVGNLNHVLRVRPLKTRRELGNLLVVAPNPGRQGPPCDLPASHLEALCRFPLTQARTCTWRFSV
jgi:hypothetical protein